jgi:hypothetical protein
MQRFDYVNEISVPADICVQTHRTVAMLPPLLKRFLVPLSSRSLSAPRTLAVTELDPKSHTHGHSLHEPTSCNTK